MPDITQEHLLELQQWANLGQRLVNDKRTKTAAEKLVKVLDPNIETSDDLAQPLLAPLQEKLASVVAELADIKKGASEWNQSEQVKALKKQGYTDDGIEKIRAIADERKLDLDVAAAVFDKTTPAPSPKISGVSPMSFGNDLFGGGDKEKMDLLFSDPDAFMAQEINAINQEFANAGEQD